MKDDPDITDPEVLEVLAELLEQYARAGGTLPPTKESVRSFFRQIPPRRRRA